MLQPAKLTKEVGVLESAQVCVAGGGIAGVAAALASAAAGVDTVIVEKRGALGWEISHGLELFLSGAVLPKTLKQIVNELAQHNAARDGILDPGACECILDRLVTAAKVRVHFRTFAGGIDKVLVRLTTKSGPLAVKAAVLIDATENARVARAAGAKFQAADGAIQRRAFMLCAVTPPKQPEKVKVDSLSEVCIRPTLWPNEAHVKITYAVTSPERAESESRFAIARTIETLRRTQRGFETASLSLSAHEAFAVSVPRLNADSLPENVFVAGPALLGRHPTLEERAELGEKAANAAVEQLRGVAAR